MESIIMTAEMYYRNYKWHPIKAIDGIIFVSNFSQKKHEEFDARFRDIKSLVLYNCPDEKIEKTVVESIPYDSYYLYYGRLSKEKGVHTLIKAFEKFPSLRIKIVGTGPIEADLTEYCNRKDLRNVEFLG